jgi:hypothetical protein
VAKSSPTRRKPTRATRELVTVNIRIPAPDMAAIDAAARIAGCKPDAFVQSVVRCMALVVLHNSEWWKR